MITVLTMQEILTSPRSNEKRKESYSKIRGLFHCFKFDTVPVDLLKCSELYSKSCKCLKMGNGLAGAISKSNFVQK